MDVLIRNPRRSDRPPSKVRTLIIDDDPSIASFLKTHLEDHGFEILPALTGQEGLALAGMLLPDLILLDHRTPASSTGEMLRRLRDRPETRRIPLVIVTERGDFSSKKAFLESGVTDLVEKPFDVRELQVRLEALVARRREQDEDAEAARINTVREVVASVSHEVNNPLAAILMCAEALELRLNDNAYAVEKSRTIQENALRIRNILKRMDRVKVFASKPYVAEEWILDLDVEERA